MNSKMMKTVNDLSKSELRYKIERKRFVKYDDIDIDALEDGVYNDMNVEAEKLTIKMDDIVSDKLKCILFEDDDIEMMQRKPFNAQLRLLHGLFNYLGIDFKDNNELLNQTWLSNRDDIYSFFMNYLNVDEVNDNEGDFYTFSIIVRVLCLSLFRSFNCDLHNYSIRTIHFCDVAGANVVRNTFINGVPSIQCTKCMNLTMLQIMLQVNVLKDVDIIKLQNFAVFDGMDDDDLINNFGLIMFNKMERHFVSVIDESGANDDIVFKYDKNGMYTEIDEINIIDKAVATKCISVLLSKIFPHTFELKTVIVQQNYGWNKSDVKSFAKLGLLVKRNLSDKDLDLIIAQLSMHRPKMFVNFGISGLRFCRLFNNTKNGVDSSMLNHKYKTILKPSQNEKRLAEKSIVSLEPNQNFNSNIIEISMRLSGLSKKNSLKYSGIIKSIIAKTFVLGTNFDKVYESDSSDSRIRVKYSESMIVSRMYNNVKDMFSGNKLLTGKFKNIILTKLNEAKINLDELGSFQFSTVIKHPVNVRNGSADAMCLPEYSLSCNDAYKLIMNNRRVNRFVKF